MAVFRTAEDLTTAVRNLIGEDNISDSAIELMESINETYAELTAPPDVDWEEKFKENDKMWRQRYINAFSGNKTPVKEIENPDPDPETITYDDIFKEV